MNEPLLSLVIPTRNRPRALSRLLESLACTTYLDHRCDVHVVVDRTLYEQRLLQRISAMPGVYLHWSLAPGPAAARNLGASCVKSTFVAFVDDDCVAPPSFIDDLVSVLLAEPSTTVAVGGAIRPLHSSGSSRVARYLAAVDHLNGPITSSGAIVNMASANLCVRAEAFRAVGGFDQRYQWAGGEDQHLLARLREIGALVFSRGFFLYHDHDVSLAAFVRKFFRYGRGVALSDHLTEHAAPLDTLYRPVPLCLRSLRQCLQTMCSSVSDRLSHLEPQRRTRCFYFLGGLQEVAFQLGYHRQLCRFRKSGSNDLSVANA